MRLNPRRNIWYHTYGAFIYFVQRRYGSRNEMASKGPLTDVWVDPFAMLGASGDPEVFGLCFRYDENDRWPRPNPTGLKGVMAGYCLAHYLHMRAAVEAVCERKFGSGGPFHPDTSGPWKDSLKVRSATLIHDERFKECVALQVKYVYDAIGKFLGTAPFMFPIMYLQAHHIDLEFYDAFYKTGAYLKTHTEHMAKWHPND